MQAVTVFLNERYRARGCCCFSLKVGTNIIGILNMAYIIFKFIFPHEIFSVAEKENSTVKFISGESDVIMVFMTMVRLVFLAAAAAMVLGNITGKKELMLPFVYLKFVQLIVVMIVDMVMLPMTFFFLAKFNDGLIILAIVIVGIALETRFWQVVQCRILELEETVPPETRFTRDDPEIPAEDDFRNTSMQSAGITSSTDVASQILP